MRKASNTDKTIKLMGATGNHQPRTGSRSRKSVEAANAKKRTAEKMMYDKHPIEGPEEKHGKRQPSLQKHGVGRCTEAGMQLSECRKERAGLCHGIADPW